MNNKQLTTWEAACIITDYGIGAGVLSMPYVANIVGFPASVLILVVALKKPWLLVANFLWKKLLKYSKMKL